MCYVTKIEVNELNYSHFQILSSYCISVICACYMTESCPFTPFSLHLEFEIETWKSNYTQFVSRLELLKLLKLAIEIIFITMGTKILIGNSEWGAKVFGS